MLEREQRLKTLRGAFAQARGARARRTEEGQSELRARLAAAEAARDASQSRIQSANRAHADLLGQLEASRARAQESTLRRARLEEEGADIAREIDTHASRRC